MTRLTGTETIGFRVILENGMTGRVADYNDYYLIYTDDNKEVEVRRNDFQIMIKTAA